jgi:signal transduction histidine kinase
VFEKFYRGRGTSKADGGVGLGLTICRAIVRAHGGRIVACAREGGGTLVEFTLPLSAAEVNADVLRERQLTP